MKTLLDELQSYFGSQLTSCVLSEVGEVTIEVEAKNLLEVCQKLRDQKQFAFEQLIDLCGVDYLAFGDTEWSTEMATEQGFSRGRVAGKNQRHTWNKPRFAAVYHLISYKNNQRLRVRCFANEDEPIVPSVVNIWNVADWYEREAFDMYGIVFEGHPDLRRLLTDYGFIGHPFRKDFPLFGHVEMRYDENKKRVVYEPVEIEARVLVPKVIRDDQRYAERQQESGEA